MYKKILKFRNMMDYIFWKEENSYTRKLRKKFLPLGENQTHDPRCSSLDILSY